MTISSVGRFLWHEFKLVLAPTIYFFCAFNLVALTSNLVVRHYWFALSNFLLATVMALIVGKVILVTDKFRFMDRYHGLPLWRPILFKSVLYTLIVLAVRILETCSHIARDERGIRVAFEAIRDEFTWQHFAAVQIWLFASFVVYVTVRELSDLSGRKFVSLLFQARPMP